MNGMRLEWLNQAARQIQTTSWKDFDRPDCCIFTLQACHKQTLWKVLLWVMKYKLTHVETWAYNALASDLTFLVLRTPYETAGLH